MFSFFFLKSKSWSIMYGPTIYSNTQNHTLLVNKHPTNNFSKLLTTNCVQIGLFSMLYRDHSTQKSLKHENVFPVYCKLKSKQFKLKSLHYLALSHVMPFPVGHRCWCQINPNEEAYLVARMLQRNCNTPLCIYLIILIEIRILQSAPNIHFLCVSI